MRIGFFADEYLPRLDGVITSMINSGRGLEELGHEVFFIVPAYPHTKPEYKIIRVPSTPIPLSDNVRSMLPSRKVKRDIAKLDLDIIHSHTPFAAAQIARKVAGDLGLPHVTTFHTLLPVLLDYYPLRTRSYFPAIAAAIADILYAADLSKYQVPKPDEDSRFKSQAWKWTGAFIDSVDHVVSPSEHFARKLEDLGAGTSISIVPNSLDSSGFSEREYEPHVPLRLVAVGRLSPEKRQYELIQAMARLEGKKYKLTIVGGGPDRKRIASLIKELKLDNVELTGSLPPDKVKKLLKNQDIGVLASHGFDNQPMTVLEYLASSLPVLYCDQDLEEGLNESNSFLSGPSSEALAKTISKIKPSSLVEMSKAAYKASLDFDIESNAASLEEIYKSF